MPDNADGIWMKIVNARLTQDSVEIQVEGDQGDREPTWWPVAGKAAGSGPLETYRTIVDGIDKRRVVLARLGAAGTESGSALACNLVRVQFADSRPS